MNARLGWFCAGLVFTGLSLEVVLRVLPTSTATFTGYHLDPNILTYPPGHAFRTSQGWALERPQTHRANNFGFIAAHDFMAGADAVALIGDSYVEASMLPPTARLDAQLERALKGPAVYAMGGPGSNLLDYVERVRLAHSRLGIREFIIVVERGDVRQSLCGSGNVHADCLDPATLEPRIQRQTAQRGAVADILRRSALAQYLFSQVRLDVAGLVRRMTGATLSRAAPTGAQPTTGAALRDTQIDTVVQTFFQRLEPYRESRITIVLGCDLDAVWKRRPVVPDPAQARLAEAARTWGARVVETEPLFRAHVERGGLALGVSPSDAHWNEKATALVASAVAMLPRSAR